MLTAELQAVRLPIFQNVYISGLTENGLSSLRLLPPLLRIGSPPALRVALGPKHSGVDGDWAPGAEGADAWFHQYAGLA